ncbi:hypothetical protein Tco_0228157 [Tanacetum coccineum]
MSSGTATTLALFQIKAEKFHFGQQELSKGGSLLQRRVDMWSRLGSQTTEVWKRIWHPQSSNFGNINLHPPFELIRAQNWEGMSLLYSDIGTEIESASVRSRFNV